MVDIFKLMCNQHLRYPGRVMRLTEQTSNAVDVSITGVLYLVKLLLEIVNALWQSSRVIG